MATQHIEVKEFYILSGSYLIFDVRSPSEYKHAHIPNAINLPLYTDASWQHYVYWGKTDKAIYKKINVLIKDIDSSPFKGIGKPEPLKYDLAGCCSRE